MMAEDIVEDNSATLIDGKALATRYRAKIKQAVTDLKSHHKITPGLAVVLVGEDPASQVYVRNKAKQTVEVGMQSFEHKLDAATSIDDLLALVERLNNDEHVHGILVQLPLSDHLDSNLVINAIDPHKDVDGLHPINAGRLMAGQNCLVPCTPLGCILLAKQIEPNLSGLNAVVVGRSILVGKPVAQLLLNENCTVTIAHSKTADLKAVCRDADVLVAAVGRPKMIRGDWIKPGAIVIDVGINRVDAPEKGEGKTRLVGDVDFDVVRDVAGAITPVPGGAGPMTIACLLRNTLQAACDLNGIEMPALSV